MTQNTAVALRDTSAVMLSETQLNFIAKTEFVPKAFRGNLPAIMACVATGRALGLPDLTSLRGINIIEGKASLSAELMDAIVRAHGHSITGSVDDKRAIVRGRRADNGDEMEATFTLEMAQKAGLLGKQNWQRHPDDMMWARAVSKLCRRLFADCFAGATYVPEELEATADEVMDEYPSLAGEPSAGAGASTPPVAADVPSEQPSPATEPQIKKLNVLVGTLREAGHITTENVYAAVGRAGVAGDDGELHWSPLRDSLTKDEAHGLIDRLERFAETIPQTDGNAGDSQQAGAASSPAAPAPGATVVPAGVHAGKTFAEVAADENGPGWFLTQLKKVPADAPARESIEVFVAEALPETWASYIEWKAAA